MTEENEIKTNENEPIKEKFDPLFQKDIEQPVPNNQEDEEVKIITNVSNEPKEAILSSVEEDLPELKLEIKYTSHPICMKVDNSDIKMIDLSSTIFRYRDYPIAPDGNIPNSEIRSVLKVPFEDCSPVDIQKPASKIDDTKYILEEILLKYLPEELINEPPSAQTDDDMAKLTESRHTRLKTVVNLDDNEDLNKDLLNEAGVEEFMEGMIQNISMKPTKSKRKKYARQITKAAMMNQMERKVKEKDEKRKLDLKKEEQRNALLAEETILKEKEIARQDSIDVDILDTLDKKLKDTTVIAQRKESEIIIVASKVNVDELFNMLFKELGRQKTYVLLHKAKENDDEAKVTIDSIVKGRQNRLAVIKAVISHPHIFPFVANNIGGEDVLIKIPLMMEDEKFGDRHTQELLQAQVSQILGDETLMVKFMSHLNWILSLVNDKLKNHTNELVPDILLLAFQKDPEAIAELNNIFGDDKTRKKFMDLIRLCNDQEIENFIIPERLKKKDSFEKSDSPQKKDSIIMKEIKKLAAKRASENDFYGSLTEEQKRLLPSLPDDEGSNTEFFGTIAKVLQTKATQDTFPDEINESLSSPSNFAQQLRKRSRTITDETDDDVQEGIKFTKPQAGSRKKPKAQKEAVKPESKVPESKVPEAKVPDLKRPSTRERSTIRQSQRKPETKSYSLTNQDLSKPIEVVGQGVNKEYDEADRLELAGKAPLKISDLLQNYYDRIITKPWWPQDAEVEVTVDAIMLALIQILSNVANVSFHFDVCQSIMELKRMFQIMKSTKIQIIDTLNNYFEEDSRSARQALKISNKESQSYYYKRAMNYLNLLKCFDVDCLDIQEAFMRRCGPQKEDEIMQPKDSYEDVDINPRFSRIDSKDLIREIQEKMKSKIKAPISEIMLKKLIDSLKYTTALGDKILISEALQEIAKTQPISAELMNNIVRKTAALYSDIKEELENKILQGEASEVDKIYNQFSKVSGALIDFVKDNDETEKDSSLQVLPTLENLKENPNLLKSINKKFIEKELENENEKTPMRVIKRKSEVDRTEKESYDMKSSQDSRQRKDTYKGKHTDDLKKATFMADKDDIKVDFKHSTKPSPSVSKTGMDLQPTIQSAKLHEGIPVEKVKLQDRGYKEESTVPTTATGLERSQVSGAEKTQLVDSTKFTKNVSDEKISESDVNMDATTQKTIGVHDDPSVLLDYRGRKRTSDEIEKDGKPDDILRDSTDRASRVIKIQLSRRSTTELDKDRGEISGHELIKDSLDETGKVGEKSNVEDTDEENAIYRRSVKDFPEGMVRITGRELRPEDMGYIDRGIGEFIDADGNIIDQYVQYDQFGNAIGRKEQTGTQGTPDETQAMMGLFEAQTGFEPYYVDEFGQIVGLDVGFGPKEKLATRDGLDQGKESGNEPSNVLTDQFGNVLEQSSQPFIDSTVGLEKDREHYIQSGLLPKEVLVDEFGNIIKQEEQSGIAPTVASTSKFGEVKGIDEQSGINATLETTDKYGNVMVLDSQFGVTPTIGETHTFEQGIGQSDQSGITRAIGSTDALGKPGWQDDQSGVKSDIVFTNEFGKVLGLDEQSRLNAMKESIDEFGKAHVQDAQSTFKSVIGSTDVYGKVSDQELGFDRRLVKDDETSKRSKSFEDTLQSKSLPYNANEKDADYSKRLSRRFDENIALMPKEDQDRESMIISQKVILEQIKDAIASQKSPTDQSILLNIMTYLEATDNIGKEDQNDQQVISKILSELFMASQVDQSQIGNISKEMMQHFIEKAPMSENTKLAIENLLLNDLEKMVATLSENKDTSPEKKNEILIRIHDLSNIMKTLSGGNDVADKRLEDIIRKSMNITSGEANQDALPSTVQKRISLQMYKMLNEEEVQPKAMSFLSEETKELRSKIVKDLSDFNLSTTADLSIPEDVVNNLLVQLSAIVTDTDKGIELSQAIYNITQVVETDVEELIGHVASRIFMNLITDMQTLLCHTLGQRDIPPALIRCTTNLILLQNLGIRDLDDFKDALLKFKNRYPNEVNFSKNPLMYNQISKPKHKLNISKHEIDLDSRFNFLRNVKSLAPIDYAKGIEMGLISVEDIKAVEDLIYQNASKENNLPVMFSVSSEDQLTMSKDYKIKSDLKENMLEVEFLVKQKQTNPYTMKVKKDSFDSIIEMARDERPQSKTELVNIISTNPALLALTNIGTSLNLDLNPPTEKPNIFKSKILIDTPTMKLKTKPSESGISIQNFPTDENTKVFDGSKRRSTLRNLPPIDQLKSDLESKRSRKNLRLSKNTETKMHKNVERKQTGYKPVESDDHFNDTSLGTLRSRIKEEICKEFPYLEDKLNLDGLMDKVKDAQIIPKKVLMQTKHFQRLYGKTTTLLPFIGKSKTVIGNILDQGLRALHFNLGPGTLVRTILDKEKKDTEIIDKDELEWWNDDSKRIDDIMEDDPLLEATSAKFLTNVQVQHCRMTNRPPYVPSHEWAKLTVPSAHHNLRPDLFGTLDKSHHCPHHMLAHKHLHRHGISITKHLARYDMIEIINKSVQENAYIRIQNSLLKCLIRVLEEK